jgi:hypothetical protein
MGLHLRPIHRHRSEVEDARFAGDHHDLSEQRLERRQVLLPELRDRAVGRKIAHRQHAIGDIFFQLPRDPNATNMSQWHRYNNTVTIIRGSNG